MKKEHEVTEKQSTVSSDSDVESEKVVVVRHLKTVAFDHQNYFVWQMQFVVALQDNDLEDYLTGNIELNTLVRRKKNQLVLGWIDDDVDHTFDFSLIV